MDSLVIALSVALGIGLAIGLERERSQAAGGDVPAGLRTFAVASVAGAIGAMLPGDWVLPAILLGAAGLSVMAYQQSADAGLTSEFALLATILLGALAVTEPALAAGAATVLVVLLHGKAFLHHLVISKLKRQELNDALVLAAAALVVWPLLPDEYMGPFQAWNPHRIWLVVLLVMATGAAGHIATRVFGSRAGVAAAGLFGGFASSVATIGAMGGIARKAGGKLHAPVAGALLSTVATFVQMMLVLGVTSIATLRATIVPLAAGLLAIAIYAGLWTWRALREPRPDGVGEPGGRAFDWRAAGGFALLMAVLQLIGAATQAWLGSAAALPVAVAGGFADAHAAAVSVGALVAAGRLEAAAAVVPVLAALTSNTLSKIVAALAGGGRFAWHVGIGLVVSMAATWAAAIATVMAVARS